MTRKIGVFGWILTGAVLLLGGSESVLAQRRPPQYPPPRLGKPQFPRRNPRPVGPRVNDRMLGPNAERKRQNQLILQAIGLTQDQRNRMTQIWSSHEEVAITTGRRVRQARQALDRAIMNEQYDEPLIRQCIDEMAAAIAEKARLQARMRAEVRSVLTSDQVARLKELQRQQRLEQRRTERQQQQEGTRPPDDEGFDLISLLLSDAR